METIRYSKNNLDFTKELRAKVKDYFRENNIRQDGHWQIMIKTGVMSLVYLGPYFLMLSGIIASVPLIFLCFFIMGLGMAGLGMVTMHDANHGSFSKHKRLNSLFSKSLYLLGGFPPNWRYQHNTLHHGFTNVEGYDEDIAPAGILKFSPHRPHKKIYRYQYIYAWFLYGLMTLSWITAKDFKRLAKYKKMGATLSATKSFTVLFIEVIISKIMFYGIFLVLPLMLLPVAWYWTVAGFVFMNFVSGFILSTIFQTAHVVPTSEYPLPDSNNKISNNWTVHQLYTTCDFAPNSRRVHSQNVVKFQ